MSSAPAIIAARLPHQSCHGEPLSMWCSPCRLTRTAAEAQRTFGEATVVLSRVLSPQHGRGQVSAKRDIETAISLMVYAKAQLDMALLYAQDLGGDGK